MSESAFPHGRSPSLPLPRGRLIHDTLWLSDDPAPSGLWPALRADHPHSGLWPLLLDPAGWLDAVPGTFPERGSDPGAPVAGVFPTRGSDSRPPVAGSVPSAGSDPQPPLPRTGPSPLSRPSETDAAALLARWWGCIPHAARAPFGDAWPGLSDPLPPLADPDDYAGSNADQLLERRPHLRLALVDATRGSDSLTEARWAGATARSAEIGIVLHSWEDRFGARVLGAGHDSLWLSVAAPPSNRSESLHVAAEHAALCPAAAPELEPYAETLIDASLWHFHWH